MLEENAGAVARVSKTFGQNGELILNLYDSFPKDFNLSEPLFVLIDKLAVPLFCDHFQRRGQSKASVLFGDIDTEHRASELIGHELYLNNQHSSNKEPDKEDEEIHLEDLVGYTVTLAGNHPDLFVSDPSSTNISSPLSSTKSKDKSDHSTDRIEEFIDGNNPLFRVRISNREVLIPAVEEFITNIDQGLQLIEFDLPDGLLDLYS